MVKRDLHAHAIGLGTARSRRGEAVPTGLVEREGGVCAKCVRRRRSEAWRARPDQGQREQKQREGQKNLVGAGCMLARILLTCWRLAGSQVAKKPGLEQTSRWAVDHMEIPSDQAPGISNWRQGVKLRGKLRRGDDGWESDSGPVSCLPSAR